MPLTARSVWFGNERYRRVFVTYIKYFAGRMTLAKFLQGNNTTNYKRYERQQA